MPAPRSVVETLERDFARTRADLEDLARIPGVSSHGFDLSVVEREERKVAATFGHAYRDGS